MFDRLPTTGFIAIVCTLLFVAAAYGQQSPARDFIPDFTFEGSQLTEWESIGQANWKASEGVITGTATDGSGALLFDRSFESTALFARFKCDGACDAGLLFRMQQTDDGMSGLMVAMEEGTLKPYRIELDKNGQVTSKAFARRAPGGFGGGGYGGQGNDGPVSDIIAAARDSVNAPPSIAAGKWNKVQVYLTGNAISSWLNGDDRGIPEGQARAEVPEQPAGDGRAIVPTRIAADFGYGPVGLFVGSGAVAFNDVAVKDLLKRVHEPGKVSSRFRMQQINPYYYAWGGDVADINGDWFGRINGVTDHGGEISVYDFNRDGLNDVVTSLSSHGCGL